MKVLVIGAMGHIGSYLVPELVREGHQVHAVSRGNREPYEYDVKIWEKVKCITASREEFLSSSTIEDEKYDVVCDLVSFSVEQMKELTSRLKNDEFYLAIGSIWAYESKLYIPVDERHPKNAEGENSYGRRKGDMEDYIISLSRAGELRACIVHPGHISGRGWVPLGPLGNFNTEVYSSPMLRSSNISSYSFI